MRLASWSSTVPPTELAAVLERASEVSQNGALDSPAEPQPFLKPEGDKAFRARCLSAASSAAPRGSVIAGKAWAAYADWLFAQHAKHASVGTAAEGRSSLQDAHEAATDSSSGQTAAVQRSAGQQAEEASNRHAVDALHAYCAALECAGLSGGQSGSPEDHIAALLRILQVHFFIAWQNCVCICLLVGHGPVLFEARTTYFVLSRLMISFAVVGASTFARADAET